MEPHTLRRWRNRLPHWEIDNGTYFVTVRCAGSLPDSVKAKIKALQTSLDAIEAKDPEFEQLQRQIFLTAEKYLDRGQGFVPFKNPKCCRAFIGELDNFEAGWQITDYVIMPNHIHFVALDNDSPLSLGEMMKRFKGRTARHCNQAIGRSGAFWQRDWFDRWVRSNSELEKVRRYIAQN
ncbi:MAG TPA: transposase, partial [Opitutales bacterium]|nr:transposase [Opitutales bacterium]